MRVQCCTSNDYSRFEWPDEMACRPQIGDYVYSKCRTHRLKVTCVTHTMSGSKPMLEVELS